MPSKKEHDEKLDYTMEELADLEAQELKGLDVMEVIEQAAAVNKARIDKGLPPLFELKVVKRKNGNGNK